MRVNSVLYDNRRDRWQLHNCFDDPAYRNKQEELAQLTRSWMTRFRDPFMGCDTLFKLCCKDGIRPRPLNPAHTGELRGRPVELYEAYIKERAHDAAARTRRG